MKADREEKKYFFYMLIGILSSLVGIAHFFFFIFSDPKIFKLTAIGKIPSSTALILSAIGTLCILRAWKIEPYIHPKKTKRPS